jgi:hypothetical protein
MPTDKDLKRLVRRRMQKTGESYTSARANLQSKQKKEPSPDQYARLAGMTDEAVKAKTGCTWERWVRALDKANATDMTHREIAKHIFEKYKVSGWWAQTVTVGYERIKGLREIGQRRGGSFEANKSKTFAAPLAKLYASFSQKRVRDRWLGNDVPFKIHTSTREKSMRVTWEDDTSVEIHFNRKDNGKSQVSIQHCRLPSKAAATKMKEYWGARLNDLNQFLTE